MISRLAVILVLFSLLSGSCKEKKKKVPHDPFFPVVSFLQSQAAHVDTSVYSIKKYVVIDSLHTDTTYIPREEFRAAASDFLSLPDISTAPFDDRYTEENQFDQTLGRVTMLYLPVDAKKEEIQRQEILIKPDPSGDKVSNIIINTFRETKDSSIEKKLYWKADESFQVTTIKQYPGKPEITTTYKVAWNENE